MSLFLSCPSAKSENLKGDKDAECHFTFTLIHITDPSKNTVNKDWHSFHGSNDWGFPNFESLTRIKEQFLSVDDSIQIKLRLVVKPKPPHMRWDYDPRKATGHIGLRNMGATCYMNSLLQAFFHIPRFREAVYLMPTEESVKDTIPLAMQRVFFELQNSPSSVETGRLIKSFGWTNADAFQQHDVQEFQRVLTDNLEEKMKGTSVDNAIGHLFSGKFQSVIQCINVDFCSSRTESFYDLSLNVKGCKSIYESFEQYGAVEQLDGANKYRANAELGLQDARKWVQVVQFPPLLHLQLKRFEFNPETMDMDKVNDRFEFPLENLDLAKHLKERVESPEEKEKRLQEEAAARAKADLPEPVEDAPLYSLYGVLIHSGSVNGGHYYAYIRPFKSPDADHVDIAKLPWYKFDDESVFEVTPQEVMQNSTGGAVVSKYNNKMKDFKSSTSAYMLMYVRNSEIDKYCRLLRDLQVPQHLQTRFGQEREIFEKEEKERKEAHLYTEILILSVPDIIGLPCAWEFSFFPAIDAADAALDVYKPPVTNPKQNYKKFKALKTSNLSEHLEAMSSQFRISADRLAVFLFWLRPQGGIRPTEYISPAKAASFSVQPDRLPSSTYSYSYNYDERPKQLLLCELDPSFGAAEDASLVLLKHFNTKQQLLTFIGTAVVRKTDTTDVLITAARALLKAPEDLPLQLFLEIRAASGDVKALAAAQPLSEVASGDIFCVQDVLPEDAVLSPLRSFPEFLTNIINRVFVEFVDVVPGRLPPFTLELSKTMTYAEAAAALAKEATARLAAAALEKAAKAAAVPSPADAPSDDKYQLAAAADTVEPANLLLKFALASGGRKAVSRHGRVSEWEILQSGANRSLFFEVVNYDVALLDQNYVLQVTWRVNLLTEMPLTVVVRKDGTPKDFQMAVKKRLCVMSAALKEKGEEVGENTIAGRYTMEAFAQMNQMRFFTLKKHDMKMNITQQSLYNINLSSEGLEIVGEIVPEDIQGLSESVGFAQWLCHSAQFVPTRYGPDPGERLSLPYPFAFLREETVGQFRERFRQIVNKSTPVTVTPETAAQWRIHMFKENYSIAEDEVLKDEDLIFHKAKQGKIFVERTEIKRKKLANWAQYNQAIKIHN